MIRFKDCVHALFLRGIDERAGINDQGVGFGGIIRNFHAVLQERAEHDLRVTKFLAQPKEMSPTRTGCCLRFCFMDLKSCTRYSNRGGKQ